MPSGIPKNGKLNPGWFKKGKSGLEGKHRSPADRKKISERMKGENNPMKRPEIKEKFSGENSPAKKSEVRKKISEKLYGIIRSPEFRKTMSELHRGEKHPAWQGGISDRKSVV